MGVLAIAQGLAEGAGDGQAAGEGILAFAGEPGGDGGVIGGGTGIGLARELAAQGQRGAAMLGEFGEHGVVLGDVGQDDDEIMVLRGGAGQRGAANVDVLHAIREGGAARHRGLEGIEVRDDHIDRGDMVLFHLRDVLGQVAPGQDAAMDLRHQRLHPAVHDLGEAGVVGHVDHGEAGVAQCLGGAAGGQDFHAARGQSLGEFHQSGFVGDGDQRAADGNDVGHYGPRMLDRRG